MVKMILGFIALFALVFGAIEVFTNASGREKIQLISSLGYAMVVTVLVMAAITAIVVLF